MVGGSQVFNPRTSLDVRLAFLRVYEDEFPVSSGVDLSQFGPNWSGIAAQLPRPANWPNLSFNGGAGVSAVTNTSGTGSQLYWHQNVYALSANLSKVIGPHPFKFAAMVRRVQ